MFKKVIVIKRQGLKLGPKFSRKPTIRRRLDLVNKSGKTKVTGTIKTSYNHSITDLTRS